MPRIIWGTLAAAAVTITLTGCGLTSNAGTAASEGGGSATPTTSTTAETQGSGSGTGTGSPGDGSPAGGAPSTGTGGGSGTGTGDGSGTGTGSGSGSGEGEAPGDGRGGDGGGAGGGGGGGDYPLCTSSTLNAYLTNRSFVETNRYVTLVMTNTSRTTCNLRDFAGLELLNASGVIDTDVRHNGTARTITLDGHETAFARLHWTSEHAGDEGDPCQPTPTTLRVYTLYQTDPHTVPWTYGPICNHGRIWLTPFSGTTDF